MRRSLASRISNDVRTKYFALKGGLRLEDPPMTMPDGALLAGENYECLPRGGYRRVAGYERYDGQTAPSDASYWVLNFDGGTAAIAAGDIVDGATSTASGEALIDAVVTSGSYGGGDAAGYLVLTAVSGTFQDNENLQVSAVTKCLANGTATENGASTDANDALWSQDAIETQRAKIAAIPGSGQVRGVGVLNGAVYGFRNNAGGTAVDMYKATTAGWALQSLGRYLPFTSGGTTEIVEGNTITGAISGATAVITRVALQSGSWAGGDAAGYLIFASQTGTFQAENLDVGASLNLATIAGNSTAITLPAAGRYEFAVHNFFGTAGSKRLYGVNGVGTAFEWDGTVFVPIITGAEPYYPTHIAVHREQLFLGYSLGSIQHSAPGLPYNYTAGAGASELGLGDTLSGMVPQAGGTLAIFGRNLTKILYGSDVNDWDFKTLSDAAGAIEWTVQDIGRVRYLDDRGLTSLEAVQEFGDFNNATISQDVERVLESKRGTAIASISVKAKSQYRLFFTDGTGIILTFNGNKIAGYTLFSYDDAAVCIGSGEDTNGAEILFFGASDGMVYQIDAGTSFDGGAVTATCQLNYSHLGSPSYNKRWRKVSLEVEAANDTVIEYQPIFNYGSSDIPTGLSEQETASGSGAYWDDASWDQFVWSSDSVAVLEGRIDGEAANCSLRIASTSTYIAPHTLFGVTYHYSMRRLMR